MTRLQIVHLVVAVIAGFETLVQASYYLDDTGSNITYVGNWIHVSGRVDFLDSTKLYNGTIVYCQPGIGAYCAMAIPFNGSGITLYSMVASRSVYNVSIDAGPPTSYQHDGVLGCCNSTIHPLYNYTSHSVTSDSLSLGYHTLHIASAFQEGSINYVWFDYAFVDSPDNSKPTASTSDVHPSTTSSSAKSKSRSVIGPAIGGAVGGILVITIAILFLFWKRRQTRRRDTTLTDPDANTLVSSVDRRPIVGASYRPNFTRTDPDANIDADRIPNADPSSNVSPSAHTTSLNLVEQPPLSRLTSASLDPVIPHSSSTAPSTLPLPVSANDDTLLTVPGQSSTSDSALVAQEARFLRHLYDRNAPAEEIAELMQAMQMRAREGATVSKSDA